MDSTGVKGGYWSPILMPENKPNIHPKNISEFYFTHLFYASVVPDEKNNYVLKITPIDEEWMPIFTKAVHGKQQLAILSIGGRMPDNLTPNPLHPIFSKMVSTQKTRKSFIDDSIAVAKKYGFDGLELDWEFPKTVEDKKNLVSLFEEWRPAIAQNSQSGNYPQLLCAAVYYAYDDDDKSLANAINNYVHFVDLRCYDYHGSWENSPTAEHACLRDPSHGHLNTEHGISTWKKAGLDTQKLVVGLPLYGRTWTLKDPTVNGVGAPANGVGSGNNGVMRYYQIVQYIQKNCPNPPPPLNDLPTGSMYTYAEKNWIGYEDENTIAEKVKFAKANYLGGYFLWALGYDNGDSLAKAASDAWDGTSH